jgi:hypothetical protein
MPRDACVSYCDTCSLFQSPMWLYYNYDIEYVPAIQLGRCICTIASYKYMYAM